MNSQRRPDAGRNAATFLALLGLVMIALGLLFLVGMVLPSVFGILSVLCGFVFFGVFHYLLWGWWLSKQPRPDDVDDHE